MKTRTHLAAILGCTLLSTLTVVSSANACALNYQAGINYSVGNTVLYNGYEYTCTVTQGRNATDTAWQCSNKFPKQETWDYYWVRGLTEAECRTEVARGWLNSTALTVSDIPGVYVENQAQAVIHPDFGIHTRGEYLGGQFTMRNYEATQVRLAVEDVGLIAEGNLAAGHFTKNDQFSRNSVLLATQNFSIETAGKIRVGTGPQLVILKIAVAPSYSLTAKRIEAA